MVRRGIVRVSPSTVPSEYSCSTTPHSSVTSSSRTRSRRTSRRLSRPRIAVRCSLRTFGNSRMTADRARGRTGSDKRLHIRNELPPPRSSRSFRKKSSYERDCALPRALAQAPPHPVSTVSVTRGSSTRSSILAGPGIWIRPLSKTVSVAPALTSSVISSLPSTPLHLF